MGLRIVVTADAAAIEYKDAVAAELEKSEYVDSVTDLGLHAGEDVDYPHLAVKGARMIKAGEADRGVFLCGTGMGVAISANKVPGIRASTAHDSFSVERLVLSNNAQVLCLGQRVIGVELAKRLAREFVSYTFDPQSHSAAKVEAIESYETGEPEQA
ncbi:RpiB/LacA/LacB family sugar-phosphate isomerase [Parenemella sanctibonifatiensis]|uniref:D-erythrulose 4-phosphate isomerase n=1 Tax=Parenemella sanctibonifatiensis TaxID=2016505 RepID=A0A255E4T7_9ACTN|nr:RpiB/LacA/LacB family sugar-phosphate isomerase [Parenemella sanctibonifatiensis]OYN84535.1 D-erythrulose-4-phosphate isomerase 1 [Parenemella sanctibonifatiensis]OYN92683.1 D-erythrulose-4-phosphate isomerase 1 [Parenemella sanctibonifatiensis]